MADPSSPESRGLQQGVAFVMLRTHACMHVTMALVGCGACTQMSPAQEGTRKQTRVLAAQQANTLRKTLRALANAAMPADGVEQGAGNSASG
jgi:hypothetical protein